MQVRVRVHFGQVEPDAACHQDRSNDERRVDGLALENERQRSADKRRDRKISTRTGGTEIA